MIVIQGLVKSFGDKEVLCGVDLEIKRGEFLTLVGPNGAGKTTLLRILATLVKPDGGKVVIDGLDLNKDGVEIRRRIGLVSHHHLLYDELTAEENLIFYGMMYQVPRLRERIGELLKLVGLDGRRHERVRTFSRGMLQRLAIARALIHDPPILLLDEPFTGLDQRAAKAFRELLSNLVGKHRTILMTTHNLEQGLTMSHRLAILHKGRIAYQASKEKLSLDEFRDTYNRLVKM
ncbi:MAG TPA: heme ABC exporter ATP-binding protein CcmA [Chloroflexi bacterium]|nr:heme ABC exporter ATP-binding protein CcmA [Chloroflexota bacterium]